jgi:NAD(P)-dependent dehydrogenase (short-subunit alcohol dehydrogenase family)
MHLKPIRQQVVAVVGATSGIGRETALRFARQGARMVVAGRSEPGLASLVEEIRREGGEATPVVADVAEFDQVRAIAEQAVSTYGRLDTWVHLAAVSLWATFEQTTPEEFRRILEVNLLGQVYGAKAALPHLRREGLGALIHVSSVEARRPLPLQSAYAASKHGMSGFLEVLRMELQHEGVPISVTEILPASIDTPLFEKARTKIGVRPKGMPPIYPPELVADAILHAAEHPVREIVVGGAGKVMLYGQRLSPQLMDAALMRTGFQAQRTDEPKRPSAPDNMFQPLPGLDRVHGSPTPRKQAVPSNGSPKMSPAVRNAAMLTAAVGAAVALIGGRAARGERSPSPSRAVWETGEARGGELSRPTTG